MYCNKSLSVVKNLFTERDFSRLLKLQKALDKCPRCGKGPMVVDTAGGELFCSSCGFVVKEKIEEAGPEWRAFSKEEKDDRSRGGIPTSIAMHDMGLATVIGGVNKDASGKSLSASMKATVERLRTWDSRSQVHEPVDRSLRQAFSELDRLSDKLIKRHPHVFGDVEAKTSSDVLRNWEAIKAQEIKTRHVETGKDTSADSANFVESDEAQKNSVLAGVSSRIPALLEAFKLSSRAAHVGFDWSSIEGLFEKLDEETAELRQHLEDFPAPGPRPPGRNASCTSLRPVPIARGNRCRSFLRPEFQKDTDRSWRTTTWPIPFS